MDNLFTRTLGFFALLGLVAATSLAPSAIALDDLRNITLYAQYAAAAYCDANNNNKTNLDPRITCAGAFVNNGGQSNCKAVEAAGANAAYKFNTGSAAYNTTGFVALDNVNKLIVVSFRGTDNRSIATSLTNVESKLSAQKPIPLYCANCSGAKGYVQAFSEVNTTVIATIQGLRITNSDYQVVATGHSLGGAVAAFATLELRRLGIPVHFASYGMPRTSNPQLADFLTSQDPTTTTNPIPRNRKQRNFRVIHVGDYTPDGIGLNELFSGQFRHVTPSFNITTPNGVLPGTNDVNIVSTGGTSQVTGLTLTGFIAALAAPHKFYLGLISACF